MWTADIGWNKNLSVCVCGVRGIGNMCHHDIWRLDTLWNVTMICENAVVECSIYTYYICICMQRSVCDFEISWNAFTFPIHWNVSFHWNLSVGGNFSTSIRNKPNPLNTDWKHTYIFRQNVWDEKGPNHIMTYSKQCFETWFENEIAINDSYNMVCTSSHFYEA